MFSQAYKVYHICPAIKARNCDHVLLLNRRMQLSYICNYFLLHFHDFFSRFLTTSNLTTNEDIKGAYSNKRTHTNFNPFSKGNAFLNCCDVLCGPVNPSLIDARGFVTEDYLASRSAGAGNAATGTPSGGQNSQQSGGEIPVVTTFQQVRGDPDSGSGTPRSTGSASGAGSSQPQSPSMGGLGMPYRHQQYVQSVSDAEQRPHKLPPLENVRKANNGVTNQNSLEHRVDLGGHGNNMVGSPLDLDSVSDGEAEIAPSPPERY